MTIYDIAQEAGVSASTVSRVINKKKGVNKNNRILVETLLKKYNFEPNASARGLVQQSTKIIGIGGVPLLPGEEIAVSEDVAASPMVQHFSTIGKIALEPESAPSKGKGKGKGKGKDKDESDNDSDSTGSTGGEDESKNEGGTGNGSDAPGGEA